MSQVSSKRHELIPDPDDAPSSVRHLPLAKRIQIWADLVDENDVLVKAGLRAKIGAEGDLPAAYRDWYARQMADHEQVLYDFVENLARREAGHGE